MTETRERIQTKINEILEIMQAAGVEQGWIDVSYDSGYIEDGYDWRPSQEWAGSEC